MVFSIFMRLNNIADQAPSPFLLLILNVFHFYRQIKNAPAKRQERMPLEGSAPLSQNSEGNTAAAISDVNDKHIITQERDARIKAML